MVYCLTVIGSLLASCVVCVVGFSVRFSSTRDVSWLYCVQMQLTVIVSRAFGDCVGVRRVFSRKFAVEVVSCVVHLYYSS